MNDSLRARLSRSRMIWLPAHPSLHRPLVSSIGDTQEDIERETSWWGDWRDGGKGVGEETNPTTAKKPIL